MIDTLQNFAEVGIALAGFSAIAAALNPTLDLSPGTTDRGALLTLLESAGLVVFFALLPQVLTQAPISETSLWKTVFLFYGSCHVIHWIVVVRRNHIHGSVVSFFRPLEMIGGILALTQIAVGLKGGPEILRLVYLVVLTWHTVIAAISFGGVIMKHNAKPPT